MFESPLSFIYEKLNPKWGAFANWKLPLEFQSSRAESLAVRQSWGIFDVSHMGQIEIFGPQASQFLERVTTGKISTLESYRARYALMLYPWAGVLDDVYIYCLAKGQRYILTCNASNRDKVRDWLIQQARDWQVQLSWERWTWGFIAIQGPQSWLWVQQRWELGEFKKNQIWEKEGCIIATTGYTGEIGVEIMGPATILSHIWQAALNAGCTPCGLVARDILRTEMGYPLYGHEFHALINPSSMPIQWAIRSEKGFIGSENLTALKLLEGTKTLVGITWKDANRTLLRPGTKVWQTPEETNPPVGWVTSGTFSFFLNRPIALAFVEKDLINQDLWAQTRNGWALLQLTPLPFISKKG